MSEWHTGWTEGYASARSEAQAEILRLRAENEKLREESRSKGERIGGYVNMLVKREAEIEKIRAERDECERQLQSSFSKIGEILEERNVLRAALKPFAEKYKINDDSLLDTHNALTLVNVGDLRAAAATLKETGDD